MKNAQKLDSYDLLFGLLSTCVKVCILHVSAHNSYGSFKIESRKKKGGHFPLYLAMHFFVLLPCPALPTA